MNTIAELALEFITAVCAFILPRLILSQYGSTYNGIISSITQFIGTVALLKSGIGSVSRAALYRPLAENDSRKISEITNATAAFMRKIARVFLVSAIVFACIFPLFVMEDFSWPFTFFLVLILSLSTFGQYFFGLTYQMVLEADQRNYIISVITAITTVMNTVISSLLIIVGFEIHIVKLVSAVIFIAPPIFYNIYVTKKYKIDSTIKGNSNLINQRWDAFGHQVANFINTNVDVILTTIVLGVKEVSVYTVYYLIGHAVQRAMRAFSTGTTAAFGNMLAKKESAALKKSFGHYEFLIFYISTIVLSIASVMIVPFIALYTKNITDANYVRHLFGILVCISVYFASIKLPYEQLIFAAGEFKKTKKNSITEAVLNVLLSAFLSLFFGLNGIVFGTCAAALYRIITNNNFINKNLMRRNRFAIFSKMSFSALSLTFCILISRAVLPSNIDSYTEWIIYAIIVSLISVCVVTLLAFIFDKEDFIGLLKRFLRKRKMKGLK